MAEHSPPRPQVPAEMAAAAWSGPLPASLSNAFPDAHLQFQSYLGQNFVTSPPALIVPLLQHLRNGEGFDFLVDLTAVDYPKREARFEIVYILYSFQANDRMRIKLHVRESDAVPSITSVYLAANWLEREVFDMFGIHFSGHPNLKRILLPDEWNGHPLRKDSSITGMDNEWVQANLGIESGQ